MVELQAAMNDWPRKERAKRLLEKGFLTPRDEKLLTLYCEGKPRTAIARELGWMGGWNGTFPAVDRVEGRLKLLLPPASVRHPNAIRNTPEWFWHRERFG